MLRFNLNVCDSHKFLKRNLNFNFYQKVKRTPLQIDPRQKSAHWYVETAYISRRQKTCLSSSYLVIESPRKQYTSYSNWVLNSHSKVLSVNVSVLFRVFLPQKFIRGRNNLLGWIAQGLNRLTCDLSYQMRL